jgi:CubicO group peptidase (beta-lactamase class C family)
VTHCSRIARGLLGFLAAALLSARADSLDETIIALMQKRGIPGASVAIVQDGEIVRAKGYGVVEAGGTAPVTEATLFQAASISKPVTALGVLRLVEAQKLELDTDVNTALKSWQVPENEFTAAEKVTLRRVLSHTAGLTGSGFLGYAPDADQPTLLQMLAGEKPANSPAIRVDILPGTQFRYSGGGYVVLQQLVIDVANRPYPEFMHETVLKPLGMLASSFEQPLPATLATKTATAHGPNSKPLPGRWRVHPEMAPAGLWTTPSDLARFAIAMQQALAGKSNTVISPATAQLMVTPVKNRMGLGFLMAGSGPTERFTFNGRNQGFDSQFVAYRGSGQAAVVMINTNDRSSFFPRVMAAIAQHYGWRDYPPYAPPAAIEDKEPDVTAQIRKIVEEAQQGTFDRELFTVPLAEVFAVEVRRDESIRRLQGYGALKSIMLVGKQSNGANRSYRYHVLFENESTLLSCSYNGEGKVSSFGIGPD